MGTRRLRDLHQRKDIQLALFDQRADRRAAAQARFGVKVFATRAEAMAWAPEALIISTPPGTKGEYVELAFELGLHHFAEADIWTHGAFRTAARLPRLVSVSSASLRLLPLVKGLGSLVRENLGSLLSYQLALGTYMPGWHSTEGSEYYGRHRDTAPAREMVCFELTWLIEVFGPAAEVAGKFEKYGSLPGDTEDTWSLLMRLANGGTGQLTSSMACPREYLRGSCFGSGGLAAWDVASGEVTLQTAAAAKTYQFGSTATVLEAMYHEEINAFVDAALGRGEWPDGYALMQQSSATLAAAEKSSVTGKWVKVDLDQEPDQSPPRS